MSGHIVKAYEQELRRLRALITAMGGMVEAQLAACCRAVLERDEDAARAAIEADPQVDATEHEADAFVIRLLALRQPVAQDLRLIVASLKITAAMERIGDHAANIAKRSAVLAEFDPPIGLDGLANMARLVQHNLKLVIDAFGDADPERALTVWRSDAAIDELYTALFRALIARMMERPELVTPCTHLLFVIKNLERIGDHATNIAETIHYAVRGTALTDARPKGDVSPWAVVRAGDPG